jgi:hypothetical protein
MREISPSNHEISFIPGYVKDQEKILNQIQTRSVEDLKKDNPFIYDIYSEAAKRTDFKRGIVSLPSVIEGRELKSIINKHENGILTIVETSPYPKDPKNYSSINNYFIFDTKTNKFFDVASLWETKEDSVKQTDVVLTLQHKTIDGRYLRKGYNDLLVISEINNLTAAISGMDKKLTPNQIDLAETAMIFHSLGHKYKYQYMPDPTNEKKLMLATIGTSLIPFLKNFYSDKTNTSLEKLKKDISEKERNAVVFSLSAIRKLKTEGIDLARDLNNNQVSESVSYSLNISEKVFKNINGPKIIQSKKNIEP